jgi:hypothetical protein
MYLLQHEQSGSSTEHPTEVVILPQKLFGKQLYKKPSQ